ncbi:hypothetical protein, partial [endosymbiont of Lamellibrachia barhami]|uniref:hypothetical protein n=1 Tax=endosymbiont of Lamellibrachia barhami TaxID=205975 RepID=UPI001C4B9B07
CQSPNYSTAPSTPRIYRHSPQCGAENIPERGPPPCARTKHWRRMTCCCRKHRWITAIPNPINLGDAQDIERMTQRAGRDTLIPTAAAKEIGGEPAFLRHYWRSWGLIEGERRKVKG